MNKNHPQSLSAAKKGAAKGLKNVLSLPQEQIWPIIKNLHAISDLQILMKTLIPDFKHPGKPMSWTKLRKLSKEERSAVKKEFLNKNINKDDQVKMSSIVLGVNAVTRALEKSNLCSVILDSTVEPMLMVKHVVVMGQNKKIPVILVPFLKTLTMEKLGCASAALGIKMSEGQLETCHFYKLHKKVANLAGEFSTLSKAKAEDLEHSGDLLEVPDEKMEVSDEENVPEVALPATPVYKYRSSVHERAFVPPKPAGGEKKWEEFISFGDIDTEGLDASTSVPKSGRYMDVHDTGLVKTTKKLGKKDKQLLQSLNNPESYAPLKVKQIQGNPSRTKATKLSKAKKRKLLLKSDNKK